MGESGEEGLKMVEKDVLTQAVEKPGDGPPGLALPVRRVLSREMILLGFLLVELIVLSILSPHFLTLYNLLNTTKYFVEIGLLALGLTMVIITAGIDLSVGSNVGMAGIIVGYLWLAGLPLPLAILGGIMVSVLGGFFNGWVITRLGIPPLIVTLGTWTAYRGVAMVISQARPVSGFPEWFYYLGQGTILNIPVQFLIFVAMAVVVHLILSRSTFGRLVYVVGNNPVAARFSGVNVRKVLLEIYTFTGFLAGLSALVLISRTATARADAGVGYEMDAITAVVLGGASIAGGQGTVTGTVLGVVVLSLLRNGMDLAGMSQASGAVLTGIVLVLAVLSGEWVWRRPLSR